MPLYVLFHLSIFRYSVKFSTRHLSELKKIITLKGDPSGFLFELSKGKALFVCQVTHGNNKQKKFIRVENYYFILAVNKYEIKGAENPCFAKNAHEIL